MKKVLLVSAFAILFSLDNGFTQIFSLNSLNHLSRHGTSLATARLQHEGSFWAEGLKFSCTGCGKCCKTDGEVWFDTEEFSDLIGHLKLPISDVIAIYVDKIVSGWVKIKDSKELEKGQCIFLEKDGRRCSIYDFRPQQCRTYPYWPRLLASESNWIKESLLPEDSTLRTAESKVWSFEDGGCEGINHPDAVLVHRNTIHINHELYKSYHDTFPYSLTSELPDRLISKVDITQRIKSATIDWLSLFAMKYDLPIIKTCDIRFTSMRVFLGTGKNQIVSRLRYEVYRLLAKGIEDPISPLSTLLMLPFAFVRYQDFEEWQVQMVNSVIPMLCDEINSESNGERILSNELEWEFFHPSYCYPGHDDKDIRHFEGRSPFPTLVLRIAHRIPQYRNSEG